MNPQYINPQGQNLPPSTSSEQITSQMSNMTLGTRPPSYGAPAPSKSPLLLQENYINGSINQPKPPIPYSNPPQPNTIQNQPPQNGPHQGFIPQPPTSLGPPNGPQGQLLINQSTQPSSNNYQPNPGLLQGQNTYRPSLPQGFISNFSAQGISQNSQDNISHGLPNENIGQIFNQGQIPPPLTNQGPSIMGQIPPNPINQTPSGPPSGNSSIGNMNSAPQSLPGNQLRTGTLPQSNQFSPETQLSSSGIHNPPFGKQVPTGPPVVDGMIPPNSKMPLGMSPSGNQITQPIAQVTQIPTGNPISSASIPHGNQPHDIFPLSQNPSVPPPGSLQTQQNPPPLINPPINGNQMLPISNQIPPGPSPPGGFANNKPTPPQAQILQGYISNVPPVSNSSPSHSLPPAQHSNNLYGSNVSLGTNQASSNIVTTQSNITNPYKTQSQIRPPMKYPPDVNSSPRSILPQNPNFQSNQHGPQPPHYAQPSPHIPPPNPQYNQTNQGVNQLSQPPNQIQGMPPPPIGSLYGQIPPRQPEGHYPPQTYSSVPPTQGHLGQPGYQGPPHMPIQSPMGQIPQNQAPRPMDPPGAPGARRLDPDQMPSPIQVMADDQRNRGGVFVTNQRGLVPPLVTTNFTVQDEGHCSPRLVRATAYTIPATPDMVKQTNVPLGLIISPLAENQLHLSDFGTIGPVRCVRCKAYMSPMMQWIDGGRRFHCPLCKATTDCPEEYFAHLDHTGQRVDRGQRPELSLGAYELVATIDYCRDNILPQPPALIFILDVSYNSVRSGLLKLMCNHLLSVLECIPPSLRVGFITYSSQVHFYNVSSVLAQPQRLTVPDIGDVFVPLLEGFLVQPHECTAIVEQLLNELPTMFNETRETEIALWPAVKAGLEALKAAQRSGRLLVFNTTLPLAEAPGKLRSRDERKLLGTDKERNILSPQNQSYNQLAQECVENGVGIDLFIMNNAYCDLATIGQLSRFTGGQIYKYTYFQADLDGERLLFDLKHNVSRTQAFDAIMRVRTSTGIRATDFHGHMYMSNTIDMELATIDQDKGIAVELKHDDKLSEEEPVLIQVALLYTNIEGQRRLRIMNLGLRSSTQMADLYRACDLDAVLNLFSKQLIHRLFETAPKPAKDALLSRCASMLACYRKHCASPSSAGQLILPECMKLLPLYLNCLLRCDAVSGGPEMSLDDRSFAIYSLAIMDVPSSVVHLYPRLIPVTDIGENTKENMENIHPLRCSYEKLREDGAFLLDNGLHMFLWMGLGLSSDWARDIFGAANVSLVDTDQSRLPDIDTPRSVALREFIEMTRAQRKRCMRLTLVRQRDKMENVFKHFLVEDRGFDGSASYVDFLCHMHKEIRTLLT